jgi:hypothetical protein
LRLTAHLIKSLLLLTSGISLIHVLSLINQEK